MVPNIKNILYVSDLSDNSTPALEWAITLAYRHHARITFLHVIEDGFPQATMTIRSFLGEKKWKQLSANRRSDFDAWIKAHIQDFCQTVSSQLVDCPLVIEDIVIHRGEPAEVILEAARSRNFDLIAMGTHGAGAFKGAMVDNTAKRVMRRSKVPVFAIPLLSRKQSSAAVPKSQEVG